MTDSLKRLSLKLVVGNDTCFDVKSKDAKDEPRIGKKALAKLEEQTREDGSETEVRLCQIAVGSDRVENAVVIARMIGTDKGDAVNTRIETWAFTQEKNDKLLDSFSGTVKSTLVKLDDK